MKKINAVSFTIVATLSISITLLAGCESTAPYNQEIGTVTGAVVGGAAGNAIFGGSAVGTIGGAAAGALVGNQVGKNIDNQY